MKLLKDQEELEQKQRENALEFQQKFRDYSRLPYFISILILVALILGAFLGVNEIADGIICKKSNPLCIQLRVKQPKKVI